MRATGAEAAVVEGANSIAAIDGALYAAKEHGVMLYNSMSGDALAGTAHYTMMGGSLTAAQGPAFYVTNTTAVITISGGAEIDASSGVLLRSDSAGTGSGNTGAGRTTIRLSDERLSGNLISAGTGTNQREPAQRHEAARDDRQGGAEHRLDEQVVRHRRLDAHRALGRERHLRLGDHQHHRQRAHRHLRRFAEHQQRARWQDLLPARRGRAEACLR